MLLELKIRNLAIIEQVEISFGSGLNVLTGETGAGKSILLVALSLVLGGRSDRDLIRTGAQEAWVEAVFDVNEPIAELVREWGVELEYGEPLALRRTINANGRSRAYANSVTVSANGLRQLAPLLLDFGRQHEQTSLLNAENHLQLLDRYAGVEAMRMEVENKHRKIAQLIKEQRDLFAERENRRERSQFLHFQRQKIDNVDPQPKEEEELEQELMQLDTAQQCAKLASKAEQQLRGAGQESIRELLAGVVSTLEDLSALDNSTQHVVEDLQNALIAVEEAASSMRSYRKNLFVDKERMSEAQERLDQIIALYQRHGGNYEGVKRRIAEIDKELKQLQLDEQRSAKLNGVIAKYKGQLLKLALPLSEKRRHMAEKLRADIEEELRGLAMKDARFCANFAQWQEEEYPHCLKCENDSGKYFVAAHGLEKVHFLLSANIGEELRPLERVASGGELSRIMLTLKLIVAGSFPVATLVLDEIDAGVSGTVAGMLAEKLCQIATQGVEQIICISHTPQVAAKADHHFHVDKHICEGRTSSRVIALAQEQRILEISRMLAGDCSPEQALALAKELVKQ